MTRLQISRLIAAAALVFAAGAPAFAVAPPKDDHGAKKRITGSETFVEISSLTASIIQGFDTHGVLQVEAGLEIADSKLRARALRLAPRLRSACSEALRHYTGDQYSYGRPPDADRIAYLLQEAVDQTLGEEGAQLILSMVIIHSAL